jgi:hypothetical protein
MSPGSTTTPAGPPRARPPLTPRPHTVLVSGRLSGYVTVGVRVSHSAPSCRSQVPQALSSCSSPSSSHPSPSRRLALPSLILLPCPGLSCPPPRTRLSPHSDPLSPPLSSHCILPLTAFYASLPRLPCSLILPRPSSVLLPRRISPRLPWSSPLPPLPLTPHSLPSGFSCLARLALVLSPHPLVRLAPPPPPASHPPSPSCPASRWPLPHPGRLASPAPPLPSSRPWSPHPTSLSCLASHPPGISPCLLPASHSTLVRLAPPHPHPGCLALPNRPTPPSVASHRPPWYLTLPPPRFSTHPRLSFPASPWSSPPSSWLPGLP